MKSSSLNKQSVKLITQNNFFDYSTEKKEEIMRKVSDGVMKQQRASMKKYNKLKLSELKYSVISYSQPTESVWSDTD